MLPKHKISEIFLNTSDPMLKHQKWQHWKQHTSNTRAAYYFHLAGKYLRWSNTNYRRLWWVRCSAAHTDKIILIFCEYKNYNKQNNSTIICDILNQPQENFVIEIKQISSHPVLIQFFSKINIRIKSWSKKIAIILQESNPDPAHAYLWLSMLIAEVGPDYRSGLRQDSAFFFRIRSKKFGKNGTHTGITFPFRQ